MAVSISASATTSSLKTLASLPQKALSLASFSANPNFVSFSLAAPSSLGFRCVSKPSPFVLRVAVSSEYDQDEETFGGGGGGRGNTRSSDEFKLFVGNLPFNCDSAQLAGLFERAGNVEIVEVIYDKETGRSRGFAFVTMSSMAEVEAASQQFNGYELDGRALRVSYGPPPPRDESYQRGGGRVGGGGGGGGGGGNQVYVGNLPWSADNSSLESLFSEQGTVVEAKVVYDRDSGRSRGFGFVTFESANEVSNAIEFLNGADFDGRQIRVTQAEAKQRRSF